MEDADVTVGAAVIAVITAVAAAEAEVEAEAAETPETAAGAATAGTPARECATGPTGEALTMATGQDTMTPPLAEELPEPRRLQMLVAAEAAGTDEVCR